MGTGKGWPFPGIALTDEPCAMCGGKGRFDSFQEYVRSITTEYIVIGFFILFFIIAIIYIFTKC